MQDLQLPADMEVFFRAGRELQVDQRQLGMGYFVLKSSDELAIEECFVATYDTSYPEEDPHHGEDGRYIVPVVSLLRECGKEPFGKLLWLPEEKQFATYDDEHDNLYLFADTTWGDIEANPFLYLDAQWSTTDQLEFLEIKPWENYPWFSKEENHAAIAAERTVHDRLPNG